MYKKLIFLFLLHNLLLSSQNISNQRNDFSNRDYYPITDKPYIRYLSDGSDKESIILDAKPSLYLSIYNDMVANIEHEKYRFSDAVYIAFLPHIRMYNEESKPVKTPSYQILLGWQRLLKLKNNTFLSFLIETGHYSNGQSGCAFNENAKDGSIECQNTYNNITNNTNLSDILNRVNGNFSTNFSRLGIQYELNNINNQSRPVRTHSFLLTWEPYHNNLFGLVDVGGYSKEDIKIYGKNRFNFNYGFTSTFKNKYRFSFEADFELIDNPHPSVTPLRSEFIFSFYPFNKHVGFFLSYTSGHDNYNYRFVDDVDQFSVGLNWDWFAPFEINRAKIIRTKEKSRTVKQ